MSNQHVFESTIGPGPFKFHSYAILNIGERGASYSGPHLESGCGTCTHCGTAITNICVVKRGDGLLFGVGSSCIRHVNLPPVEISLFKKAKKDALKARKLAKIEVDAKAAKIEIINLLDQLDTIPHPNDLWNKRGMTFKDYAAFCFKNSGKMGLIRLLKTIKSAIAKAKGEV